MVCFIRNSEIFYHFCLETEVAPLWDPDRRSFIGLMTTYDYIHALMKCLARGIPMIELSSKSIADILQSPIISFSHPFFDPLEPDESIFQLCRRLYDSKSEFAPIVDQESGSLVATLGYFDVVHLLDSAAKQVPNFFGDTLEQLEIVRDRSTVITIKRSATVLETLSLFENHNITGAPVIDETNGRVINYYHKSDPTFIIKASEPDAILINLRDMTIGNKI